MVDTNWTIHGREFVNCNCSYGCPCQFNGLQPMVIARLWQACRSNKAIMAHEARWLEVRRNIPLARCHSRGQRRSGRGHRRAGDRGPARRLFASSRAGHQAGGDGFQRFCLHTRKAARPIFAPIDFESDIAARRGRLVVKGVTEGRGEPILNPVTGRTPRSDRHGGRVRIHARRDRTRLDQGLAADRIRACRFLRPVRGNPSLSGWHCSLSS